MVCRRAEKRRQDAGATSREATMESTFLQRKNIFARVHIFLALGVNACILR
jgi:hypothetical protein